MNLKILFLFLILLADMSYSKNADSLYSIGLWPGFRSAAISFTFDDNCRNQLAEALPMFDRYGLKMTLFTVINWSPNWTALQKAASEGHEISSHTMSHPHLGTLSDAQQQSELKDSQNEINDHIKGQKCLTIAYPYCEPGNVALDKKYYIAARGCSGEVESSTPLDFMNISSIICGQLGSVKTKPDFIDRYNSAVDSGGWAVFLIHGIDNDSGYSPLNSKELNGALDYLSKNKDKLWESTFLNVFRYLNERNNASVKEISSNSSIITIEVSDTLDNSIYNYPITLRRVMPAGWTSASVYQNEKKLNAEIVNSASNNFIMFDVVPNSGTITIKKD